MAKSKKPIGRRTGNGRKTFWAAVAVASAFCGLGLLHTWTRVAVLDRSYEASRARGENEKLAREAAKLKLEIATLQGMGRVDREAKVKLDMQKPLPARTVVLTAPNGIIASAKPAVATND